MAHQPWRVPPVPVLARSHAGNRTEGVRPSPWPGRNVRSRLTGGSVGDGTGRAVTATFPGTGSLVGCGGHTDGCDEGVDGVRPGGELGGGGGQLVGVGVAGA